MTLFAFAAYRRWSPKSPRQYGTIYRSTVEKLRVHFVLLALLTSTLEDAALHRARWFPPHGWGGGGSCGQSGSLLLEFRREILEVPVGLGHWSVGRGGASQPPGIGN